MLTSEQRKLLCAMTIPQSKCKLWHKERGPRATGTKISSIIALLKKNEPDMHEKLLDLFKESPTGRSKKEKTKAMIYGNDREENARNEYRESTDQTVVELGLVIKDKFWWAGSSPDGIILENENDLDNYGLLEIKCIYSQRDDPVIDTKKCAFLDKNSKLRKYHPYNYQIQLGLWATGAKYCHLFLYTDHNSSIIVVEPQPDVI